MTAIDLKGVYKPYQDYVVADSLAGNREAMDLLTTREMLDLVPVDRELETAFMEMFGRWLQSWESRL
jgi:hypothetical protein